MLTSRKKNINKKKRIKPKWNSKVKQRNIKMLITDKNDLSHFHGNNPTNHGRIHHHHPPPPPPPISGSKASNAASRKSKNYHHSQQQHPNNSYPTPNHMENKVSCSWAKFTWIERLRDFNVKSLAWIRDFHEYWFLIIFRLFKWTLMKLWELGWNGNSQCRTKVKRDFINCRE